MAPAAVRSVDLGAPLGDMVLPPLRSGEPYRSLLVLARLDGDPLGTAVLPVDPPGRVPRDRFVRALLRQLEAELHDAFSRRGVPLPDDLPAEGVPADAGRMGDATGPRPPVSVVIPTCCEPARLERCLESVLDCTYDDFEVIVVENRPGSGATSRMLAERFPGESRLRYLEEARVGSSFARNTGLAAAEGEVVAFADDDVLVDSGWVDRCAAALASPGDVACVAGLILPLELESDSQVLLEQFASFGKGFRRETYRLPESRTDHPLLPYTPGIIGSGANMAVRAEVLRRLGGFDVSLGGGTAAFGGEDLDVFVRLLLEGHAIAYEPRAIVWHRHPDGSARLDRQAYLYGVGLGALLAKQLLAGPRRVEFLRAVPAGVRYLRGPGSRKNVGKPPDYPARLERLERRGMAAGPFRYFLAVLRTAAKRRLRARGRLRWV